MTLIFRRVCHVRRKFKRQNSLLTSRLIKRAKQKEKIVSAKLMVAMGLSAIAIFTLIWQQDQMAIFFGSYPSVVSIFFVAFGGAMAALCVDESSSDLLSDRAEAFASGSVLVAIVAILTGLVAVMANLDNFEGLSDVGYALGVCLLCGLWATVFKYLCYLIVTSRS